MLLLFVGHKASFTHCGNTTEPTHLPFAAAVEPGVKLFVLIAMGAATESDDESYDEESTEASNDDVEDIGARRAGSEEALVPIKNNTPMEILAAAIAAASVATSVGAMIISPVNVVYPAGGLSW